MSNPELRLRPAATSKSKDPLTPTTSESDTDSPTIRAADSLARTRISVFDILRVLAGLLLLNCTLSYFVTNDSIFWGHRPSFTRLPWLQARFRGEILLTESELLLYDGSDPTRPIYLALNSTIYDVSAGPQHYGPGGSYHFFAGRDATRAFITGCFDSDLTGDIRGVELMFMPVDLDEEPALDGSEQSKKSRRQWKTKRERAWRKAKARMREVVDGWKETYDGGKGGKYFKVGKVWREEGWPDSLGERRTLCRKAVAGRPKTSEGT